MTRPIRVGVQLWPGGASDYRSWRQAVLQAEELGVDVLFGYDHFHRPSIDGIVDAKPTPSEVQPDEVNFEGWTALASWGEITTRAEIGLRSGEKRTLPAVAKHADIWHTFLPLDNFNHASKLVGELATANGRNDFDIERSSVWENSGDADTYRAAGVTRCSRPRSTRTPQAMTSAR